MLTLAKWPAAGVLAKQIHLLSPTSQTCSVVLISLQLSSGKDRVRYWHSIRNDFNLERKRKGYKETATNKNIQCSLKFSPIVLSWTPPTPTPHSDSGLAWLLKQGVTIQRQTGRNSCQNFYSQLNIHPEWAFVHQWVCGMSRQLECFLNVKWNLCCQRAPEALYYWD